MGHLYYAFTHIYSLLIEEDIRDCQNISVKLLCVYLCLLSGDLLNFLVELPNSFFCYPKFVTFPFHVALCDIRLALACLRSQCTKFHAARMRFCSTFYDTQYVVFADSCWLYLSVKP